MVVKWYPGNEEAYKRALGVFVDFKCVIDHQYGVYFCGYKSTLAQLL